MDKKLAKFIETPNYIKQIEKYSGLMDSIQSLNPKKYIPESVLKGVIEVPYYIKQIEEYKRLMDNLQSYNPEKYIPQSILENVKTLEKFDSDLKEINYEVLDYSHQDNYYQNEALDLLRDIEGNTRQINVLVELMQMSVESQAEIAEWVKEINMITTAKTLEEADTLYKKTMRDLSEKVDDAETLSKLFDYGKLTFNTIKLILNTNAGTDFEIK